MSSIALSPPMEFTERDILLHVGPRACDAGRKYQRGGQVIEFKREDDGPIESRVRGSRPEPYRQRISFSPRANGGVIISSICSCPVQANCKHVAASLFFGLQKAKAAANHAARHYVSPASTPAPTPARRPENVLPHDLLAWLGDLERARVNESEDYPPDVANRLIYVFSPHQRTNRRPLLGVTFISTRLLKTGRLSESVQRLDPNTITASNPAKYLRPSDHRILREYLLAPRDYSYAKTRPLAFAGGVELALKMLATGRARWDTVEGPALAEGPTLEAHIAWRLGDDGAQRAELEAPEGLIALSAVPPIYIDPARGLFGRLDTGLPPKIAYTLLEAPPVPPAQAGALAVALERRAPETLGVRLAPPPAMERVSGKPKPVLRLMQAIVPAPTFDYGYFRVLPPSAPQPLARLSFLYEGHEIFHAEEQAVVTRRAGEGLIEIHRDRKAEERHAFRLGDAGFSNLAEERYDTPKPFHLDFTPDDEDFGWLTFLHNEVPLLRKQGWRVDIDADFPITVLDGRGAFDATIRESSGIDWLELDLGVVVDGQRFDLLGAIVGMISRPGFNPQTYGKLDFDEDETMFVRLPDGRNLALPLARVAPIIVAIHELACGGAMAEGGKLKLTRADLGGLAEFEAVTKNFGVVWNGAEKLRAMGKMLTASGGIPSVTPPPTFHAKLRPYQADGVAWLSFLRESGFGGILADDMGLGKTVQALALIAIEKAAGRLDAPALVIAPTSLMANWRREAEKFTPDFKVLTLQGLDRKERFGEIGTSDLVLTTYPLIARDHETLSATQWSVLFLDEAQSIKNPEANTTKLIRSIEARQRYGLTGTPLENHLGELWSLFSVVAPGFLGDRTTFTRVFRTPIEKKGNAERGRFLARRIKPFLLRRGKDEVAKELPPKTEIVERIEMENPQRAVYDAIRLSMHERVRKAIADRGFARSRIVILDALLKMRQACCDPRLLKPTTKAIAAAGSAKLERLDDMLDELLAEGRRILLFSQFTSMLDLIKPRLAVKKIKHSLLTGDTRDREPQIRAFQDGKVPLFLVSLKAGGVGLNLTAADTVILYDPWWNPAVEAQAIDRAHRIGQDKPVFVHKLVMTGTIEEKMETLKEKKRALAESLFDHEGQPTLAMTEADLEMLFDPTP